MESKVYVVYDYWNSYKPMYAFESETDAQEFVLSLAEEEEYHRFSINPDTYFENIKSYKELNITNNNNMSLKAISLWNAGYEYEIQEVKYVRC